MHATDGTPAPVHDGSFDVRGTSEWLRPRWIFRSPKKITVPNVGRFGGRISLLHTIGYLYPTAPSVV